MEHLLNVWADISNRLQDARRILLLTDYDGTLTPIVERPELANLPENTRQILQGLARQPRFTVGVISGRALSDLKSKVNIEGVIYAGNHGMEIEGPGINFVYPLAEDVKSVFRFVYQVLAKTLTATRGVIVENKGLTLSVHYRQVEAGKVEEVKSAFEHVVSGAQSLGQVKITTGKKVLEVHPAVDWNKGKAVRLLMKRYGKGGRKSGLLPIYLGDDRTDEDAFAAIEKYGNGISVFIGDNHQTTSARYFLKTPAEVAWFLERLSELSRRQSG